MTPAELIGPREIARRLRVSPDTVRKWAQRGHLPEPAHTIGRARLWRWSQVRAWAESTGRAPKRAQKARSTINRRSTNGKK